MRTDCPQCRWVFVVDGSGRRHMEMRWTAPTPTTQSVHRAA
ncbi:hypothetical protein ACI789_21505 [Geodermatophilus sp. SYSU D00965]